MPSRIHAAGMLIIAFVMSANISIAQIPGYPDGVREAHYQSAGDESQQPTLIWTPQSDQPVPLLVALHTWSSDYRQAGGEAQYAKWCQQAGWAFIHPNFRGINKTPEALGSDLAVADILSAIDFVKSETSVDPCRIYCIGVSGGGHASMLMAARAPELWAGVSAWCGISDIALWHRQCKGTSFDRYATMIESVLGGAPESSDELAQNAWHRSPLKWIESAQCLPPLDINHGINDGRAGSVPFTQSILAWNQAVSVSNKIDDRVIEAFYETQTVPDELHPLNSAGPDDLYGDHAPIYRQISGNTRLTIFNGGHEIVHEAALNWLAAQRKCCPVNWHPGRLVPFSTTPDSEQSGK